MKITLDIDDNLKPLFEAEIKEASESSTIEEYAASRIEELLVDKGVYDSLYDDCEEKGIKIDWD